MVASLKTHAVKEAEVVVVILVAEAEVEVVAILVAAEVELAVKTDAPKYLAEMVRGARTQSVSFHTLKDGLPHLLPEAAEVTWHISPLVANEAVTATPKGLPQWEAGMIPSLSHPGRLPSQPPIHSARWTMELAPLSSLPHLAAIVKGLPHLAGIVGTARKRHVPLDILKDGFPPPRSTLAAEVVVMVEVVPTGTIQGMLRLLRVHAV
jgi:hypothetical protein